MIFMQRLRRLILKPVVRNSGMPANAGVPLLKGRILAL
jgi:hypothetical protein